MILFTHLKIILLHCFQFSVINGIQTDPKYTFDIDKNYQLILSFNLLLLLFMTLLDFLILF